MQNRNPSNRIVRYEILGFGLIILWVAITVILSTRKLLDRLHYLEGFLRVCAWCRKVDHDGHWLTLEGYFNQRFNTKTSHGMCPECFARVSQETEGAPPPAGGADTTSA